MKSPTHAWRLGVWAAVGQMVVVAAGVGRAVILARVLDPADLGRLFLMFSAAGLAGIGLTGFAIAGLRRVAASEGAVSVSQTIRCVVQLALAANVTLLGATACLGAFTQLSLPETLAFAAFMTAMLWIAMLSALARGLRHIDLAIQQEQVAVPIGQVLALCLCVMSRGTVSVAFLMAIQAAFALPSLLCLARPVAAAASNHSDHIPGRLRWAVVVESAPIVLNTMVWRAFIDLPLWAAGLIIGSGGSALFGVAQRLASVLQLPFTAVSSVLAPEAAALAARRQYVDLEGRLRRGAMVATLGSAVGFAVMVMASRPLLGLVYGQYFERAAQTVVVLALAQLINSAAGLGGVTLQMLNASRRLLVLSAISTAVLAALIWPLARAFGVAGLAWAWLAAVVLQNALMIHAVRRLTGMRVYVATS